MDAKIIRDFPILERRENGRRLVYLDSAATTQKPRAVLQAMDAFYEQSNANIHRGFYPLSAEATELYEEARRRVARFINAAADRVIFTSGATESINMVAHGWGLEHLEAGDEILLTPLEHHANIVPWQEIARLTGAKLVYCDLNEDFTIDVADLKKRISGKTKILAITHVSNVLGAVTPLAEIVPYAKQQGVVVLVDGAQAAPHMKVDVKDLGCDAYALSGHKMLGPTGTGVLYLSEALMAMRPCKTGGDMIEDVTEQEAVFAEKEPRRFEAGTPNIAGAVGLAAAVDYLETIGMEKIHAHEQRLLEQAWKGLSAIKGVTLYGPSPSPERAGVLAFAVAGVHPHDVAQLLADEGVCIRTGKHCAHPLHYRMGLAEGTCRASFYLYNTEEDVEALIRGVKKVIEVFR
jgi:cysteine desulfurase/selenocysteine lyase